MTMPPDRKSVSYRPPLETIVEDAAGYSIPPPSAHQKNNCLLTVLAGPSQGQVIKLEGDRNTIGRAEEADVRIDDPNLSRVHAVIYSHLNQYYVADNQSTNGTFIGSEKISVPTVIADGQRIGLGRRSIVKFLVQDSMEQEATIRLYESAIRDRLTGAYNRGVFDDRLDSELAFSTRHGSALTLMMLDIDRFKSFNDEHGHLAGDEVLKHVAAIVDTTVRTEDTFARYGGEEFAVIARGISPSNADVLGERIRTAIEKLRIPWEGQELKVTASLGIATMTSDVVFSDAAAVIGAADLALYEAKARGRNVCVAISALSPSQRPPSR
ncbi:MAG: GGDEF domain-containing protein [Polyangiaceae bacterium]|nr:GGDEF domain-containing protein [Polyangiaceae bacterium]